MAAPMLSCVMVNLAGEMLAAFKLECGHPWKSELLQAQGNMLRGPVRVLMGHEQVYPGCGLVPDHINDDAWCLTLRFTQSSLVRLVIGEEVDDSAAKALFYLYELDLWFDSSISEMTSWKLKDLAEHYQQLPQASMTYLSKVTCNYLTRAFWQNPLAKRKLDVFLTKNGNFLLPLLCHVASGTMVVRQKASNEMALAPRRKRGAGSTAANAKYLTATRTFSWLASCAGETALQTQIGSKSRLPNRFTTHLSGPSNTFARSCPVLLSGERHGSVEKGPQRQL